MSQVFFLSASTMIDLRIQSVKELRYGNIC